MKSLKHILVALALATAGAGVAQAASNQCGAKCNMACCAKTAACKKCCATKKACAACCAKAKTACCKGMMASSKKSGMKSCCPK